MEATRLDMSKFPTAEAVERAIASLNASIENSRAGMEYRMQNYYNCVDDYSYGGPCDQAASSNISHCSRTIEILQEQLKRGTFTREPFRRQVLCTLSGEIVSEKIINTRFGSCWVYGGFDNGTFVSLAKKASTYAMKGYKVMTIVETVDWFWLTSSTKNGATRVESVLVEKHMEEATVDEMKNPHDRQAWPVWCAKEENQLVEATC